MHAVTAYDRSAGSCTIGPRMHGFVQDRIAYAIMRVCGWGAEMDMHATATGRTCHFRLSGERVCSICLRHGSIFAEIFKLDSGLR